MNATSKFTASPFFVPKLMTFDYRLIDDAIRRLIDGSCCLTGEEQMAIGDLFEKLRNAVLDHVGQMQPVGALLLFGNLHVNASSYCPDYAAT